MIETLKHLKEKQKFLRFQYNIQCVIDRINNGISDSDMKQFQSLYQNNQLDDVSACFSEKTGDISNIEVFKHGLCIGKYMNQVHFRCSFDVTTLDYDNFQNIFDQSGQQIVTFLGLQQNFIILRQVSTCDICIIAPGSIQKKSIGNQDSDQRIHYLYYENIQEAMQQCNTIDKNQKYDVLASSTDEINGEMYSNFLNQLKMRYISVYNYIKLNPSYPDQIQALSSVNSDISNLSTLINLKNLILWNVKFTFNDLFTMKDLQRIYVAHCFTANDDLTSQVIEMLTNSPNLVYVHLDDDIIQTSLILQVKITNLEYLRLHFNPNIQDRRVYIIKEATDSKKLQICDVKYAEQIVEFQTRLEFDEYCKMQKK